MVGRLSGQSKTPFLLRTSPPFSWDELYNGFTGVLRMGGFQSSHSVLLEFPGSYLGFCSLDMIDRWLWLILTPCGAFLPKYHSVSFYEHLTSCHVAMAAFSMIPFFTTQAIETGLQRNTMHSYWLMMPFLSTSVYFFQLLAGWTSCNTWDVSNPVAG